MMPVCCPAVGSPGAYSKHTIARWGLLYCDISRSLARLTAVRKDWDWCGLLASLDWIPNLWRYSDAIQKQRSDSSRHPPPSPTQGCSSSIQMKLHHRETLGLYHSTGKNREYGSLHDALWGQKSRRIWKYGLQQNGGGLQGTVTFSDFQHQLRFSFFFLHLNAVKHAFSQHLTMTFKSHHQYS